MKLKLIACSVLLVGATALTSCGAKEITKDEAKVLIDGMKPSETIKDVKKIEVTMTEKATVDGETDEGKTVMNIDVTEGSMYLYSLVETEGQTETLVYQTGTSWKGYMKDAEGAEEIPSEELAIMAETMVTGTWSSVASMACMLELDGFVDGLIQQEEVKVFELNGGLKVTTTQEEDGATLEGEIVFDKDGLLLETKSVIKEGANSEETYAKLTYNANFGRKTELK